MKNYEVIQVGDKVTLNDGHIVQLTKQIGDGYTAVVFLAKAEDSNWRSEDLVVKIAKPQPETQTYVRDEYETLRSLANRILVRGFPLTPRVYGDGVFVGRYFIVMELLKGAPILGKDEDQKLVEREALEAFQQIYSFLQELHANGMTYPDLKMENFFWDPDSSDTKLRVLDLGMMGKTANALEDPECQREVYRLALGLFTSLTGRKILVNSSFDVVENVDEALLRTGITYGTRLLLSRLLNRSKNNRLTSAALAREELENLVNFWNYDQDTLFKKFEANLRRGNEIVVEGDTEQEQRLFADKYACAKRAKSALDIYQMRFAESKALSDDINNKIEALTVASSYLTEAKRLLLRQKFREAVNQLQQGEALAPMPEQYHLWKYLFDEAQIIREQQLEAIVDRVGQVIDSFANGKLEAANILVNNLIGTYPDTRSLQSIKSYIAFAHFLAASEELRLQGSYQEAMDAYTKAQTHFSALPNHVELERSYYKGFDKGLKLIADAYEEQKRANQRPYLSLQDQSTLLVQGELPIVLDYYRKLLQLGNISNNDQLLLEKGIQQLLEKGDLNTASTLAEYVNYIDEPSENLKNLRRISRCLLSLKYDIVTEKKQEIFIVLEELPGLYRNHAFIKLPLQKLLSEIAEADLSTFSDTERARLKEAAISLGDNELLATLENFARQEEVRLQKRIAPILRQIEFDLLPVDNWYSELDHFIDEFQRRSYRQLSDLIEERSEVLLTVASRINYLRTIPNLDNQLLTKLDIYNRELERRQNILSTQGIWLPAIKQKFEQTVADTIQEWKVFRSRSNAGYGTAEMEESTTRLLARTVKVMTEAASFTGNLAPFNEIAADVLAEFDLRGLNNWSALLPDSDQLPGELSLVLESVNKAMQQGRYQEGLDMMSRLDPVRQLYPQVITVRLDLLKAISYEKMLNAYSQYIQLPQYSDGLLRQIANGKDLQGVYALFSKLEIPKYLMELSQQRRASLDSQIKRLTSGLRSSANPDEVAKRSVIEYVNLRQTIKLVEGCKAKHGK